MPPAWLAPWLYPTLEYVVVSRSALLISDHAEPNTSMGGTAWARDLMSSLFPTATQWSLLVSSAPESPWRFIAQQDDLRSLSEAMTVSSGIPAGITLVGETANGRATAPVAVLVQPPNSESAVIGGSSVVAALRNHGVPTWTGSTAAPPWPTPRGKSDTRSIRDRFTRMSRPAIATAAAASVVAVVALMHNGTPNPSSTRSATAESASTGRLVPDVNPSNPGGRSETSITYDPLTGAIILFGGGRLNPEADEELLPTSTWAWNPTGWRRVPTAHAPSGRTAPALAADPANGSVLLFGGTDARPDTWRWDGVAWQELHPVHHPKAGSFAAMTYDVALHTLVLTTTCCETTPPNQSAALETWLWRGNDWVRLKEAGAPALQRAPLITYDQDRREVILLTQGSAQVRHDVDRVTANSQTWVLSGTTWVRRPASASPPFDPLQDRLGYDPASQSVILFQGGAAPTWSWNGDRWTPFSNAGGPFSPGAVATETLSGHLLLFGGPVPSDDFAELWIWSRDHWQRTA